MGGRGLVEPRPGFALLRRHLLAADIDQVLGVERAELGRIGQPLPGRGTKMQHFEADAEFLGKGERGLAAGNGRALLIDRQKDPDKLHGSARPSTTPGP